MINLDFKQRLQELTVGSKVLVSSEEIILEEKAKDGKARLVCNVQDYTVAFLNVDENIVSYLKNKKCADVILFQKDHDDLWRVKVIEFKKTMTIKSLEKSMKQFNGAILNTQSLAGMLGIREFKEFKFYSAFREERISNIKNENPVLLKNKEKVKLIMQWENEVFESDYLSDKNFYGKIKLDENGEGEISL